MVKKMVIGGGIIGALIAIIFIFISVIEDESGMYIWPIRLGALIVCTLLFSAIGLVLGKAITGNLLVTRSLVALATLWVLATAIIIEPYEYNSLFQNYPNISRFLAIGVFPVAIFWAIIWIARGVYEAKHTD